MDLTDVGPFHLTHPHKTLLFEYHQHLNQLRPHGDIWISLLPIKTTIFHCFGCSPHPELGEAIHLFNFTVI